MDQRFFLGDSVIMFTFRTKLTLLTLAPLLILIIGIALVAIHQSARLSSVQSDILKSGLMEAKRAELKNYAELAYTVVRETYEQASATDAGAKASVAHAFRTMEYGSDGYFFVYDYQGNNIAHPRLTHLEGQDLWEFRDEDGTLLIQELIRKARAGGGFTEYRWDKPSGGDSVAKLGYSIGLEKWGWMVGTGLYLDDVDYVVAQMEENMVANARNTVFLMTGFTVFCLLVIATIGLAVNISEARVANKKLLLMAQKTLSFLEKERRRISRELHDGINQLLVSARFKLERLDDALSREDNLDAYSALASADRILETGIQDLRRLARDLRPSVLDDLGLIAALESLCSDLAERRDIKVYFESNTESGQWPPVLGTALYRIAQEVLYNTEKHAKTVQRVDMSLRYRRGWVHLVISDDGEGFDWSAVKRRENADSGLGLRNIKDRVDLLDGRMILETAPGKGMKVHIKMPLARLPGESRKERGDGKHYTRAFGRRSSSGAGGVEVPV